MYLIYLLKRTVAVFKEQGPAALIRNIASYIAKLIFIPHFLIKSRSYTSKSDLNLLLKFVYEDSAGLMKPIQVRSEILGLLKKIKEIKPSNILEIGTANGGTLFLFTRVATQNARIMSIDLPGGEFGGGYPGWKSSFYKSFALSNQEIILLRADSHDDKTLNQIKDLAGENSLDFLFIDGDHTYEGVKKDFEMYIHLVKPGGIIAFHDIVPHPPESGREISRFWENIKSGYHYEEVVKDWNQGWAGIGIIRKSSGSKNGP